MSAGTADKYPGLLSPFLMRRRVAMARPHLQGRVLDVGCAAGVLAADVPAADYVGVDTDTAVLAAARRAHPEHTFLHVDDLDPAETFDCVVALAVVEHMHDASAWASGMRERLRPGGILVLTTPHRRWEFLHDLGSRVGLASPEAADEHHELLDRVSLDALLGRAGLETRQYRRFLLGVNQLAVGA